MKKKKYYYVKRNYYRKNGHSVGNPLIVAGIDLIHNIIILKVLNLPEISANTPNFAGNLAILDFQSWQICRKISRKLALLAQTSRIGVLFLAAALRLTIRYNKHRDFPKHPRFFTEHRFFLHNFLDLVVFAVAPPV